MSSYYFIGQTAPQTFPSGITASTGAFSGNVTVGGTLGVTGQATLGSLTVPEILKTAGGTTVANVDAAGAVIPASINPSTLYWVEDFIANQAATNFTQAGNNGASLGSGNNTFGSLFTINNQGAALAFTSTTTAGGYISAPPALSLMASASVTYQWRFIFRMPAASSGTNRFTVYVGGCWFSGVATNANNGPFGGPYMAYRHDLNSGNWVIGSAINDVRTTSNTSTAPSLNGWSTATITLVNGTYTFVVNGVTIGTVVSGMSASAATNQSGSLGGIAIFPDGTNFTTTAAVLLDRADLYITGLSR